MRLARAISVNLSALVVSSLGVAASETELQLDYDAPIVCPARDDFVQQLFGRAKYPDTLRRTRVVVHVAASQTGYTARLLLVDSSRNRVEREISGPSCSDVTAAIALVATVTVDGTANAASPSPVPPVVASPADDSTSTPTPASVDAASANAASSTEITWPPLTPKHKKPQLQSNFSIGVVAGVHTEIAPYASPTVGISGNYHPRTVWGSPEYRVEALVGWSIKPKTVQFNDNTSDDASFRWIATRVAACPFAVVVSGGSKFGPCGVLEVGALSGSTSSGESTGWWLAPGALLGWSVQIRRLRLRLAGGTLFPIVREHFKFRSGQEVHQAGRVGLLAELGLAWAFN